MSTAWKVTALAAAPVLATLGAYWLGLGALTSTETATGWEELAAIALAAIALFVALVATALAGLVIRSRGWLIGFAAVSAAGLLIAAVPPAVVGAPWQEVVTDVAGVLALVAALWLPVGARWLVAPPTAPPETVAPLEHRPARLAAVLCGGLILLVAVLLAQLPSEAVPAGVVGCGLLLVTVAAVASGRTPEWTALVLLAAAGVVVVVFDLPAREGGRFVAAGLAVAVLLAFAWRRVASLIAATSRRA